MVIYNSSKMKFLLFVLVISIDFNLLLADVGKCGEKDLNALMVRMRQFKTEFHEVKTEYAIQINKTNEEVKLLKETNGKQATEIQELKERLSNKSSELASQAAELEKIKEQIQGKRVLPALVPAFVVRQKEIHYDCLRSLPFENILLNDGNAFSNITNRFTAPQAGLYTFTAQLCSHTSSSFDFSIYSYTLKKQYGASRNGETSDHDCRSMTTLAQLIKGEEVYVRVECPGKGEIEGHIDNKFWTMFSGTLLYLE